METWRRNMKQYGNQCCSCDNPSRCFHKLNLFLFAMKSYSASFAEVSLSDKKQAGNGPSRRHIQGSKIAKRPQNFQVLVNWDYFYEKKLKKSLTMPKKLKGRTLWDFSTSILLQNSKKLKGGPFVGNFF